MANARVRFKFNPAGIEELLSSRRMEAVLESRARPVLQAAKDLAPVGSGSLQGAHSIDTVPATSGRARVMVTANSDHAAVVAIRTGYLSRALNLSKEGPRG